MQRACASYIVLLALFLIPSAAPAQSPPGLEILCPRAAFPPVLNGRLDDWQRLPQLRISSPQQWQTAAAEFAQYGGPEDISAEVRLLWDNQAFYLALQVRDDAFVRVRSAAEIDRGDSLVISLSDEGIATVNEFVVAWLKDGSLVWRVSPPAGAGSVKTIGRALAASPEDRGGSRVIYELAIPWSELKPVRPIPGTRFTIRISACDDDDQGMEGCLEASAAVALTSAAAVGLEVSAAPPAPSDLRATFPAPKLARFDRQCFTFQDKDILLFGGGIDYAHLSTEACAHRLTLLRRLGLNSVAAVVPWSYHQPTPDQPDLTKLRQFLALCKDAGLLVQLNIGPFAGEDWPAGAVPQWVLALASASDQREAVQSWYRELLPTISPYQLTAGGPIASVILSPFSIGGADAAPLPSLLAQLHTVGIEVPALASSAPAARDNTTQALANILDTLSFYTPPTPAEMASRLQALSRDENGPPVVSALPGDYRTPAQARTTLDLVKVALAQGAAAITLSDFAPGLAPDRPRPPGDWTGAGIIETSGLPAAGSPEVRLLSGFLRSFGSRLARAMPAECLAQPDDPDVRAAVRLTSQEGFIFLWDDRAAAPHRMRLTYLEPGSDSPINIPEAGAIYLPPGGAKILPLDIPLARGSLRYTTSEIAGIHALGDRTILFLYGDLDTPGEIALRWPGPPLLLGEVVRQSWDPHTNTIVLDYYHGSEDQYLLLDELEIVILSRARAPFATAVAEEDRAIALSPGACVEDQTLDSAGLRAVLDCPPGSLHVTGVASRRPSSITIDGTPVDFAFTPASRVLTFDLTTESFAHSQRPSSLWDQLGRAIVGGPPKLRAHFGRAWFMPDSRAPDGSWTTAQGLGASPQALGLIPGSLATLRAHFRAAAPAQMLILGSTDPAIVSINGHPVPALSGSSPERRADIVSLLRPGENEIEVLLHILPRAPGRAGLSGPGNRLPEVMLISGHSQTVLDTWELHPGLRGERAGWASLDLDTRRWHLLRLGPWRAQGGEQAEVWGAAWYRIPFALPRPDDWQIPYRLSLTLDGGALLHLNGVPFATCRGAGEYVLPLPAPPLKQGGDNLLAVAAYGLTPETGVHRVDISADEGRMTRRRLLDIRF